jgi:hypothetical protein
VEGYRFPVFRKLHTGYATFLEMELDLVPKFRLGTQWGNSISRVFIALFLKWNVWTALPNGIW